MPAETRYMKDGEVKVPAVVRDVSIGVASLIAFIMCWPFYSVPTGSRGVVTQFGAIVGVESEGLAVLPPWRRLYNFSIRAEQADIEAEARAIRAKADGDAYATLTNAKASAESLRIQNAALAQNKDVLELRRIEVDMARAEKWDGALPVNMYATTPIPFLQATEYERRK